MKFIVLSTKRLHRSSSLSCFHVQHLGGGRQHRRGANRHQGGAEPAPPFSSIPRTTIFLG